MPLVRHSKSNAKGRETCIPYSTSENGKRNRVYLLKNGLVSMKTPRDMVKIAISNSTNSPILCLPAEIRAKIFRFALSGPDIELIGGDAGHIYMKIPTKYTSIVQQYAFGLLQTCRQIYAEAATLVYSENTFVFQEANLVQRWLRRRLPAQKMVVESIKVPRRYYERIAYGTIPRTSANFPALKFLVIVKDLEERKISIGPRPPGPRIRVSFRRGYTEAEDQKLAGRVQAREKAGLKVILEKEHGEIAFAVHF
ncbi:uncharacterized protein BDR25DRAFT_99113 [Lindgomyces ingoldianus]|uniref:Uncharacterized protein n=1 Tax=Lindgomyces ingoldianus TaxID=673940 RepID=A0ACB6QAP9_9PLEO|nr:uncharacterized protein BDR25DRAFT_99113 [Lindgomyces ingoldianus]KAF2464044.1 hypothetical protein BDR25DRAFT_99113 [Lindgomyces ingoldianus]